MSVGFGNHSGSFKNISGSNQILIQKSNSPAGPGKVRITTEELQKQIEDSAPATAAYNIGAILREKWDGFFSWISNIFFHKNIELLDAATNGDIQKVVELLTKDKEKITSGDKGSAFLQATVRRQAKVVKILLEKAGEEITLSNRGISLSATALANNIEIAELVLAHTPNWGPGSVMSSSYTGKALLIGAKNGSFDVVKAILNRAGNSISARELRMAAGFAANNNHQNVMNEILAYAGEPLSPVRLGCELFVAADTSNAQEVVSLLTQYGDWISLEQKLHALETASEKGHCQVIWEILSRYGKTFTVDQLGSAIGSLPALEFKTPHQDWVMMFNQDKLVCKIKKPPYDPNLADENDKQLKPR